MKKLMEYKFQIGAIAIFLFAITSAKGGAAAMMPLIRVIIPILVVLFILSLIKKKLVGSGVGDAFRKQMSQAMDAQKQAAAGAGKDQKTIDLCSQCGAYERPGHKCEPKKK